MPGYRAPGRRRSPTYKRTQPDRTRSPATAAGFLGQDLERPPGRRLPRVAGGPLLGAPAQASPQDGVAEDPGQPGDQAVEVGPEQAAVAPGHRVEGAGHAGRDGTG